ncbi:unnamed protein product [Cylindrotheca closterium]|uniref:Protein kinase domain-containing protein n=1 Tax=Cylindrotheca closterium TaxID=2856 RepID=A0AAD2FRZ9_9STRA|nr:unnamed protein product [Cylindrotheca closterium]
MPAFSVDHSRGGAVISIDASQTFKGLSAKTPIEEESKNTEEASYSAEAEEADEEHEGEGELSVPYILEPRNLKRGRSDAHQKSAESIYTQNLSGCSWIQSSKMSKMKEIPKFTSREAMMGLVLGSGCFGAVYEVRGFYLNTQHTQKSSLKDDIRSKRSGREEPSEISEISERKFIARHCYCNNGDARYAIKKLKPSILEDDFMNGMAALANETVYLACLQHHPNIIKLRGIAVENMFSMDYFLILDRLYDTLRIRILTWEKKKNHTKGFVRSYIKDRDGEKKRKLLEARMKYAMDLMAAIAYIHEHRIIHRDIKPDNIGFDVRNDIKLFDFGLAREMPTPKGNSPDETFQFTSAGSPRYMAPEVGLDQKHNQSCDIYSFGLVFWEMLTLKRPFKNEKTMEQLKEDVWYPWGPQERPEIPAKEFSYSIQKILKECWHPRPQARPKAHNLLEDLKKECLKLRQDTRVSHTARRSTFVMEDGHQGRKSHDMTIRKLSDMIKEEESSPRLSVRGETQLDNTTLEDFDYLERSRKSIDDVRHYASLGL